MFQQFKFNLCYGLVFQNISSHWIGSGLQNGNNYRISIFQL